MEIKKIIFIHGNGSMRWSFGWAPWLKEEIDQLGFNTIFETFPDSIFARKKYWIPFLKDHVKADENTVLVGWSSGAVASMRFAEENKILGSILVAPCYTDLGSEDEKISGWYDDPWKWDCIKNNQKFISLIYSKNDELIPIEEFEHIKENLQPDQIYEFEDKGHFIREEKMLEIIDSIKKIQEL